MNGCEIMKCSDYRPNGECAYPGETCKYRSHSTVGGADGSGTATVRRTRDGVGPVADGGGIQPREVWIVLWHDEGRGDRNVGVHGVFDDATMAHDEAHKMNRESSYLYWPVNCMVTPAKNPLDAQIEHNAGGM
jgi:hypothetical protein